MSKKVTILGSTGSIGCQALEVVNRFPGEIRVVGLAAKNNYLKMEEQVRRYLPEKVALRNKEAAEKLGQRIQGLPVKVCSGSEGILEVAADTSAGLVLVALVGFDGLKPTLAALKSGKEIALANKEALVVGGKLITEEARDRNLTIYPVDSEHSAIFQCLQGIKKDEVKRVILSASGGPFLGYRQDDLKNVTPESALRHPNWKMGKKITIDSSTLMNKGFEVLEARWLFNLGLTQIDVIIHPESVVHSFVECIDGSVLAQLGVPDMTLPIQYAFFYPRRRKTQVPGLNLTRYNTLTFLTPDYKSFPCLNLAYNAGKIGGTMPACLNAANEIAVNLFLNKKIRFLQIPTLISETMSRHKSEADPGLDDIIEADHWARAEAFKLSRKEEGDS